jgi:hypothetical protein
MNDDDLDLDPGFLDGEMPLPVPRRAVKKRERALVVERDAELAPVCVQALERIGLDAEIVWTREDALAALGRAQPLAFVYASAEVLGLAPADAAEELRRLRPDTAFVVGGRHVADVLLVDAVVLAAPFKGEEIERAFESSLLDGTRRRVLLAAADAVRALEEAEAAALASLPPVGACTLLPLTA